MKNRNRIVALLIAVVMVMMLAAGCGPKKPTADDAKAYVQAVMDLVCTGDYDHSVNLVDIEEGGESEIREAIIQEIRNQVSASGLSEETGAAFEAFILKCFTKAKYQITDAVESEDGGFDVTVEIEPLDAYAGYEKILDEMEIEDTGYTLEELQAMTETEVNDIVLTTLIKILTDNLDNPTYKDPVQIPVHYGLMDEENNIYGVSEEEGTVLGSYLFAIN